MIRCSFEQGLEDVYLSLTSDWIERKSIVKGFAINETAIHAATIFITKKLITVKMVKLIALFIKRNRQIVPDTKVLYRKILIKSEMVILWCILIKPYQS